MRYLIISDIPTPWREPVFERVYRQLDGKVEIVYFKDNEKRRLWSFKPGAHPKRILRAVTLRRGDTERFFNPGLVLFLLRRRPHIALVVASMKDPSGWLAMTLCRLLGTRVALLDDSWLGRERGIGRLQRLARHVVYNHLGDAFVGSSRQTLALHKHYNPRITDAQCFLSHLVADNDYFQSRLGDRNIERIFDIMFSGRIVNVKNPVFFAEVCAAVKRQVGHCNVLIIGEGREELKEQMRAVFDRHGVTYQFAGFIRHNDLPDYYAQARLLLLPTSGDCWGVVINEAMLAGTPVITTKWTAAAGELVIDGHNGFVLPLEVESWAATAVRLLTDSQMWTFFSQAARTMVVKFNFNTAAAGILAAFRYLENSR